MKEKTLLVLLFLFAITTINAQEWKTNLEEAKVMAKEENKAIVLVFQGSDWCAPCIKLDQEIWSTNEFKKLAENELVMLKADFPRKKKNKLVLEQAQHNNSLAEKYNPNGHFPLVVVLNNSGEVLGTTGYKKTTPSAYYNELNAFLK